MFTVCVLFKWVIAPLKENLHVAFNLGRLEYITEIVQSRPWELHARILCIKLCEIESIFYLTIMWILIAGEKDGLTFAFQDGFVLRYFAIKLFEVLLKIPD